MNSTDPARLNIIGMRILADSVCPARRGREVLTTLEGIVLHVKEYEGNAPESLQFTKSASRTISVGRKPSQGYVADDPERALFRCPVVSRKHAKITFTEYGNVYITDLHSHHGTHIRRAGDLVSTVLKPEVPTVLADGDLITFGKTVGRDCFLVSPVVVRVQLVFGRDASSRAPSPLPRPLTNDDSSQDKASTKPTSGRYGVYPPSPDSSPETSDGDSDIQEISPPSSPSDRLPSLEAVYARSQSMMSLQTGRMRLLQSLLPPIHVSPETPPPELDDPPLVDEEEDMDLSSSRSASPEVPDVTYAGIVTELPGERPIIGAWPGSRSSSSSPSEQSPEPEEQRRHTPFTHGPSEVIVISDDDSGTPFHPPVYEDRYDAAVGGAIEEAIRDAERDEPRNNVPDFILAHNAFFHRVASIAEVSPRVQAVTHANLPEPEPEVDAAAVQTSEIVDALNTMRATREADEAAFTAHIQHTKERLSALDGQMVDTHARLSTRDDHLTSIQARLQGLGDLVSDLQERSTLAEREAERVDELMKEVGAAKDMLRETCDMQRETRTQMAEELEAIKALRAEAAAAIAEAKLAVAAATTAASIPNVLKRKREDTDEAEGAEFASEDTSRTVAPLPSKRRRTLDVVSTVAQTATVATMGAVAAWAALAFS
ncbi:hypothetical protein C2E23DRAFT_869927 [Lenzites betulinus]|nr:hypothetical protein C2E23DRAFT_869927 [Lenzites betulinus]